MMKRRRIKAIEGEAVYHCISRQVPDAPYWDEQAKEMMRKQLWRVADFSGVEILTYCLMSNHFHVLVRVPDRKLLSIADEELLRRYEVLYPEPTDHETLTIEALRAMLTENGPRAEAWRSKLLSRMHDVSQFMKTFKQRFSLWYNRTHDRYGTLWADRFTSVLIEGSAEAALTVAAYIDLNPVRAGLVIDPKDYRWCGYAESVSGRQSARRGLVALCGLPSGNQASSMAKSSGGEASSSDSLVALALYRKLLFGKGAAPSPGKTDAALLSPESTRRVMREGGQLPVYVLLRCRVRYFTDGLILGSHAFVKAQMDERHRRGEIRRAPKPHIIPAEPWRGLAVGHRFHNKVV